ncbi:MAG: acyltransferase family protein [Acidimicrobiales bacterium]
MTTRAVPTGELADPSSVPERRPFRADIDGLRAVAILLIVAFHAKLPFFDGGFVGVDVFFVISGYLITRNLLDESGATGRVRLLTFWSKRVRRLVPGAGADGRGGAGRQHRHHADR